MFHKENEYAITETLFFKKIKINNVIDIFSKYLITSSTL